MVEKILLLVQIFEVGILIDLHVFRSPESENHVFSSWYVCVHDISMHQKEITAETSCFLFYICMIYTCNLKLFIKIEQNFCVLGHTKEFLCIIAYECNILFVNFSINRLH